MSFVNTSLLQSAPEPLHHTIQRDLTPIAQKIDTLLKGDLDARDRQYLLWLKCRDDDCITVAELEAIATIWELHQLNEVAT